MSQKGTGGSRVITFRVSSEVGEQLEAFFVSRNLSLSGGCRMALETYVAGAKGEDPKRAALVAAIDEAIWRVFSDAREVVQQTLDETADTLAERLAARFNLGGD
jgi:hypothetical protein